MQSASSTGGMRSHDISQHLLEEGFSFCEHRISKTSKIIQKLREMKPILGWSLVIASLLGIIHYFNLSWFVFTGLLFAAFLASGGPTFPRVFFRTFYRDVSAFAPVVYGLVMASYYNYKGYTVADIFTNTANRYPHKAAFQFEGRSWSFKQVDEYTNRIANIFKSRGFNKGDVVALFMENRPEYVFMWLGLSKIGVITSLININLRLDSLLHCITVSNSKAVIFSSDLSDAILEIQDKLPDLMQIFSHGSNANSKVPSTSLDQDLKHASSKQPMVDYKKKMGDVVLYIFTSGTTGLPKPALIRSFKFCLTANFGYVYNIGNKDVNYSPLPLYHSAAGVIGTSLTIFFGTTMVICRKFSASRFFGECIEYKATMVQYIGELCRYLLLQPPRPTDSQHSIRLALGNGLRPEIWPEFQTRFNIKQIGEFYASTEGNCGAANTDNTVGNCGFTSRIFPFFYPSKLIQVDQETGEIIRDSNGMAIDCKPGQPGLFVGKIVNSSNAFRFDGYLDKKETAKKIAHDIFTKGDQAFLSGDIVVQDEYGYVYFQDRTGDTFRWRGENVSTTEVESIISKVLGMRDVVVYGVEIPGIEGKAGMVFIVDPEGHLDVETLARKLEPMLPVYARPLFVRVGQAVQMTGTFKFQKNKLKKEGFDIHVVKDQLYYFDSQSKVYMALNDNVYSRIINGKMKL